MQALESKAERAFRKYATGKGCLYLKIRAFGLIGFPDRLILGPNRLAMFIEWKRQGEVARPLQLYRIKTLTSFGFPAYVVSDLKIAEALLAQHLEDLR